MYNICNIRMFVVSWCEVHGKSTK